MAKTATETKPTNTVADSGKTEPKTAVAPETKTSRTSRKSPAKAETREVDEHIAARNLPAWMGESIKVFAGWKSGKHVTAEEFQAALDDWNNRSQGGGKR